MAPRLYATIGRAADNDVVLDDPTVSNHHARLSWSGAALVIEDLSSANGTFVDGQAVKSVRARPGVELRCGQVAVPWGHAGLRNLLKAGAGSRTLVMPNSQLAVVRVWSMRPRRRTAVGPDAAHAHVRAVQRHAAHGREAARQRRRADAVDRDSRARSSHACSSCTCSGCAGRRCRFRSRPAQRRSRRHSARSRPATTSAPKLPRTSPRRSRRSTRSRATPQSKIAARTEGPFHVEQVAEIWNSVRGAWRYVNDPEGHEYFATATETIQNGYVGDCDDFATTLASMVIAIGGKARVIFMDGPEGGHAYAEACVQGEPTKVAAALTKYYRTRWSRYLSGRPLPRTIAYRTSDECPIWLNLDWNSIVPGGAYQARAMGRGDLRRRSQRTAGGSQPAAGFRERCARGQGDRRFAVAGLAWDLVRNESQALAARARPGTNLRLPARGRHGSATSIALCGQPANRGSHRLASLFFVPP